MLNHHKLLHIKFDLRHTFNTDDSSSIIIIVSYLKKILPIALNKQVDKLINAPVATKYRAQSQWT